MKSKLKQSFPVCVVSRRHRNELRCDSSYGVLVQCSLSAMGRTLVFVAGIFNGYGNTMVYNKNMCNLTQ